MTKMCCLRTPISLRLRKFIMFPNMLIMINTILTTYRPSARELMRWTRVKRRCYFCKFLMLPKLLSCFIIISKLKFWISLRKLHPYFIYIAFFYLLPLILLFFSFWISHTSLSLIFKGPIWLNFYSEEECKFVEIDIRR